MADGTNGRQLIQQALGIDPTWGYSSMGASRGAYSTMPIQDRMQTVFMYGNPSNLYKSADPGLNYYKNGPSMSATNYQPWERAVGMPQMVSGMQQFAGMMNGVSPYQSVQSPQQYMQAQKNPTQNSNWFANLNPQNWMKGLNQYGMRF